MTLFTHPDAVQSVVEQADAEAAERCRCRRDERENHETCFPHLVAALLRDAATVEAVEVPF